MLKFRWETEFKETEIGEIPKDWEVKALSDVIKKIVKGKVPRKPKKAKIEQGDSYLPYLSVEYVRGEKTQTEFFPCSWGVPVTDEDVLIIWDGAANAGEVLKGKRGLLGSTLALLKLNDNINKFYLYSFLKFFEDELKTLRSGTDDRHVDKQALLDFLITFPPPEEQTRIATVLSWFDDLIENKRRQNEILEKTAMAIFKSWFIDFEPFQDEEFVYSDELGMEIPKGWEVKPIGEVAEFMNGLSYKGSEKFDKYEDGAYVFITLNNIEERGGFKTEFAWIKSDRLKERHFLKEGDLIFANTEQTKTGRLLASPAFVVFPIEYSRNRGVYSHHITKVFPKKEPYKPFLYLIFRVYQEDIAQTYHTGTGVWGFDLKNFKENHSILLPPEPILQRFRSLVEPLFQKIINNQKQIMILKKIRDTLLPQLVFGRLRVEEM